MLSIKENPSEVKTSAQNSPEKLRVVRSASARPHGTRVGAAAFVVSSNGCETVASRGASAGALNALARHAAQAHAGRKEVR